MAIRITSGTVQQGIPAQTAAAPREEPAQKTDVRGQQNEDRLELSEEALAALQGESPKAGDSAQPRELSPAEEKLQDKLNEIKTVRQMLDTVRQQSAQMAEQSEKQAKAMKESLEKMKRCSKIAKNIQKGHKVPPKDEKYLLENDPKLYMMAMALRMLEDQDNKRVKSELKNEEEEQQNEMMPSVEGADGAGADIAAIEMGSEASVE